jgi:hypothetical protein
MGMVLSFSVRDASAALYQQSSPWSAAGRLSSQVAPLAYLTVSTIEKKMREKQQDE